ncbi:hypothetical protein ABGB17_35910 [Sphaerisporangium sp. B11E5]|uniref:hypothetical protein n=1 Tax=Sphaerisporangium sp. B11E5 TaxID=3153563 RepID=UPI00325EB665
MPVTRPGAAALAAGGVLFLLYQTVRPYTGETGMQGAATMASSAWVASHTMAMAAFVLVTLGLAAAHTVLRTRTSATAAVLTGVGAGLVLPYYGGETFGLYTIATRALRTGDPALMTMVDDFRYGPVAATMFGAGLTLLGAGAVLAAIAARRSGALPAWPFAVLAAASVLLIPQFYGPAAVRITHGLVFALGAVLSAWYLARRPAAAQVSALGMTA